MSDKKRHSEKIQSEDTGIMIIRHPARTSWSRRDVLRGSAAALMGAYGLAPRYGLAADIPMEYDGSKFQIAAPEPNPIAPRISTSINPALSATSAPRAACSTT
jgi:hypothetical protein